MSFVTLGVTVYLLASCISQGAIQKQVLIPPPVLGLSTDPDLETVLGKACLIALPVGPSHTRKVPSR